MAHAAILLLALAAQASATASFDGTAIRSTNVEQLVQALREGGASDYVAPPLAPGDTETSAYLADVVQALTAPFQSRHATVLAPPRHLRNVEKVEIGFCPLDGSIAFISVIYGSSLTTEEDFDSVTRDLARHNGNPAYADDYGEGLIAVWDFADDTSIELRRPFYDDGITYPFHALYRGTHEAAACHGRFEDAATDPVDGSEAAGGTPVG